MNNQEDGIIVSDEALKKFDFKTFDKRVFESGAKKYPLDLYKEVKEK